MSAVIFLSKIIEATESGLATLNQVQFVVWLGLLPGSTVRELHEKTEETGKAKLSKDTIASIGMALAKRDLVDFKMIPPNPLFESTVPQRAYTLTNKGRAIYAIIKAEGGVK